MVAIIIVTLHDSREHIHKYVLYLGNIFYVYIMCLQKTRGIPNVACNIRTCNINGIGTIQYSCNHVQIYTERIFLNFTYERQHCASVRMSLTRN